MHKLIYCLMSSIRIVYPFMLNDSEHLHSIYTFSRAGHWQVSLPTCPCLRAPCTVMFKIRLENAFSSSDKIIRKHLFHCFISNLAICGTDSQRYSSSYVAGRKITAEVSNTISLECVTIPTNHSGFS